MGEGSKNFFFRFDAADLLAEIISIPEDERGKWITQVAIDLSTSKEEAAKTAFGKKLINESYNYREKKRKAGQKGGQAKASSAKQCHSSALAKPSTPLASSSNSNKNLYTTEDYAVAQQIHGDLLRHFPDYPSIKNAKLETWADEIRKLRSLDGFSHVKILAVVSWAMNDSFWSQQIKSVRGLRDKGRNGCTKFENALSSMERKPKVVDKGYTD